MHINVKKSNKMQIEEFLGVPMKEILEAGKSMSY